MKDYIWFFILFTLLEVLVTIGYFMLVKTINFTLIIGTLLYAGGMYCAFLSYRAAQYCQKRKEMIESFL